MAGLDSLMENREERPSAVWRWIPLAGLIAALYSALHLVGLFAMEEWLPLDEAVGQSMLWLGLLGLLFWFSRRNPAVPHLFELRTAWTWTAPAAALPLLLVGLGTFTLWEAGLEVVVPSFADWIHQQEPVVWRQDDQWRAVSTRRPAPAFP